MFAYRPAYAVVYEGLVGSNETIRTQNNLNPA